MGLLERALKYKKKVNETGTETLIDTIKGPAETAFGNKDTLNVNLVEIDELEIFDKNDDGMPDDDASGDSDGSTSYSETISLPPLQASSADEVIDGDDNYQDEDIIIFDNAVKHENTEEISSEIEAAGNVSEQIENADSALSEDYTDEDIYHMPEFNDYFVLFEIQKDLLRSDCREDVFSTLFFSVMGQLGVSSASILIPSELDSTKWIVGDSNGVKIDNKDLVWNSNEGILELLKSYRAVLDIENLKNDSGLIDDYYRFISVDARIVVPLFDNDELFGVLLVGEKINSEDFTDQENEFLLSLSEIVSMVYPLISEYERMNTELLGLRIESEILSDVEYFQDSVLKVNSSEELIDVIRDNFYSLGIESYGVFIKDRANGDYIPEYFEENDYLGFNESGFRIKEDNRLVVFLLKKNSSIFVENFGESSVIRDTFGASRTDRMDMFIAYPFIISGRVTGFITIFKKNEAVELSDVDIRMRKMVRFLFPYVNRIGELDPEHSRYDDLTKIFYGKIERELARSEQMNIPVSLLLISIKNHKRFYDRFGRVETDALFQKIEHLIKVKLTSGDFSARIDRGKFLIILPGKDKKYAAALFNIIKNQITPEYDSGDFKLLLTYLASLLPDDGTDLFSLLDILE